MLTNEEKLDLKNKNLESASDKMVKKLETKNYSEKQIQFAQKVLDFSFSTDFYKESINNASFPKVETK